MLYDSRQPPEELSTMTVPSPAPSHTELPAENVARQHQQRRLSPRGLWQGFERLTQLGWPRDFPIVQFPNAPLIVAFLAGAAAARTHDAGHAYLAAISFLATGVWAYEELLHGVNWFRHLLGLGYAISTAAHLALALGS
jgi:hypothetical protein